MSKRILLITQNFYPEIGSAGNRLKNIFLMLHRKGYDVKVLTTDPTYPEKNFYDHHDLWDEEELNNQDERFIRVKVKNKNYAFNFLNRLFYYLEIMFRMIIFIFKDKNKYDLIYVTTPPIFVAFAGIIAKFRYKTKMILDIRDLWPDSLKGVGIFKNPMIIGFFKLAEKYVYSKSDHIIINSQGFQKHLQDQEDKLTFIPNSARREELPKSIAKMSKEFKVVLAGNLGLAQDVNVFRDIVIRLKDYNIKFIILGYGVNKKELEREILERELNQVEFIMPVSRKECLKIMANCDIGIATLNHSIIFETVLPGRIVDYLSCQLPVVASLSGYSKKLIEQENVGLVAKTKTSDEMVSLILRLYHHPELVQEMKTNCENFIEKNFLWDNNIIILDDVIKNTIKKVNEA
ncbi:MULTISPECIES: glycosyltransferase family 4 protein [Bacillus]|uniref:glycosyltransferase family 4 protein n=1 Tax=Bacillus TaxID=1386 RepID=UPI000D01D09A|nr:MULTISPECIES: glycosyltransferase family 4 protein [Bacillus]MDR0123766.1 glycosyltransferase family 4 protein [Bacillus zhangzhouensis]PRO41925.1 glycosyltransferase WbuB [Bacillus sp. LLTC93]